MGDAGIRRRRYRPSIVDGIVENTSCGKDGWRYGLYERFKMMHPVLERCRPPVWIPLRSAFCRFDAMASNDSL